MLSALSVAKWCVYLVVYVLGGDTTLVCDIVHKPDPFGVKSEVVFGSYFVPLFSLVLCLLDFPLLIGFSCFDTLAAGYLFFYIGS